LTCTHLWITMWTVSGRLSASLADIEAGGFIVGR